MLGNFEVEIQTAQHIAGNRSEKFQLIIVGYMLATALSALGLYFLTTLGIFWSGLFAMILSALFAVPLYFTWVRRRKARQAKLHQLRMDQLEEYRAKQDLDL